MRKDSKFWILLGLSIGLGLLIAWIDSRPTWDDTGVTAAMILVVAAIIGYIYPKQPVIWALTVSAWIPMWGIIHTNNYTSLLALLFGFVGAFLGYFISKKNDNHTGDNYGAKS
jgi:uncharacterized membrane protein